jgi:hypothetical protein
MGRFDRWALVLMAAVALLVAGGAAAKVISPGGGGKSSQGATAAKTAKKKTSKSKSHKKTTKKKKKKAPKPKPKTGVLVVCQHGCTYPTIQSAVNASGANATIDVDPGTYVEGVTVSGHGHDGLHIIGMGQTPSDTILEGTNAKGPGGIAQDGIEGDNVNNLDIENIWARDYAANDFFINNCNGYLMKNLIGSFAHSYGLYVFKCVGGRMTQDVGYGNGDSAFYIGGTPFQTTPVWSLVDHDTGYENVLGYSGTNSKYVDIRDSEFYNNGAGIVPNTLDSEPYEPATNGIIEENLVYWNNFDYYQPSSPVKTVSGGVGLGNFNYPIGAGVILFGTTGWVVKNNSIFGNFLWGAASFSDPTNTSGKAINNANEFEYNTMGAAFNDPNGHDFWNDGSGAGTCFVNNSAGATFAPGLEPDALLYPSTCPSTLGTHAGIGDPTQDTYLISLASQQTGQEKNWTVHSHPTRPDRTPIDGH